MEKVTIVGSWIILLVFTLFGFVVKQPCDLDGVYLWCRLHPLSMFDVIGLILFYAGGLFLGGLSHLLGINHKLTGNEGSIGKWPFVFVGAAALGAIIIWNL